MENQSSKTSEPFANNPFSSSNAFAFQSANPFAQATSASVSQEADEVSASGATYSLIKSGPDVNPDEVEVRDVAAVEVMILWGSTVLHVEHLSPSASFFVGEEEAKNIHCDYFVPSEKLGAHRAPLVIASGGSTYAVILPRATGSLELPGQPRIPVADLISSGRAQPCAELAGAHQIALTPGARLRLDLDGLVFQVASVAAGRRVPTALFAAASMSVFLFVGLSFLVHAGFLAGMAFFKPTLGVTDDDEARNSQQLMMQQFLKNAADREKEQKPEEQVQAAADSGAKQGAAAKAEAGAMGTPNTHNQGMRFAIKGPPDNPDPRVARNAALKEAAEFGMIGLLAAGVAGDPSAPTAPWGRELSMGTDAKSALGSMWGGEIGDSFGAGGLGLSGVGEGGGGDGEGIGLGAVGTIGGGNCKSGPCGGIGLSTARVQGDHKPAVPTIRVTGTTVSGKLPPEVVQRIVRQNFGRFRMCYENGLKNNPTLAGRVAVRFVIGRDGAVASVGNGGSDLPDSSVVNCIVRSFSGLSFPAPDGGIVSVTYPISLAPGTPGN